MQIVCCRFRWRLHTRVLNYVQFYCSFLQQPPDTLWYAQFYFVKLKNNPGTGGHACTPVVYDLLFLPIVYFTGHVKNFMISIMVMTGWRPLVNYPANGCQFDNSRLRMGLQIALNLLSARYAFNLELRNRTPFF